MSGNSYTSSNRPSSQNTSISLPPNRWVLKRPNLGMAQPLAPVVSQTHHHLHNSSDNPSEHAPEPKSRSFKIDEATKVLTVQEHFPSNHGYEVLSPKTKAFLGLSEVDSDVIYHNVLKSYHKWAFTPIAKVIGLTPDAALRMALHIGLIELRNIAIKTQRPFCGYSHSEAIPEPWGDKPLGLNTQEIKELHCIAALYTEFCHTTPHIGDIYREIRMRNIYHRDLNTMSSLTTSLHERPWIVNSDYRRVAHEFYARREQAGVAVARDMGINEEVWPFLEHMLFDKEYLRLYGNTSSIHRCIWQPRHISLDSDIREIFRLATKYHEARDIEDRNHVWRSIYWSLYDEYGPYLCPVLERYAVSPLPSQEYRNIYGTREYFLFRRQMVDWIIETYES